MTVFLIIREFIRITELEIVLFNWQMPATYLTYFVPITPSISMFSCILWQTQQNTRKFCDKFVHWHEMSQESLTYSWPMFPMFPESARKPRFSGILKGYKMGTLARDGLKHSQQKFGCSKLVVETLESEVCFQNPVKHQIWSCLQKQLLFANKSILDV